MEARESSVATAFVALGSNLGARVAHLSFAASALRQHPEVWLERASALYETAAVGPAGQGPYLNAALRLSTTLGAARLLRLLLGVERARGRRRTGQRWGPRVLDLDLLLYRRAGGGDLVMRSASLTLPHPRLHERPFVLEPLAEIAPVLRHPTLGARIAALAADRRDPGTVRRLPGHAGWWRRQ